MRNVSTRWPPIPNMPEHRLMPLMQRFAEMPVQSGLFRELLPAAK
jgi:hypothetical protein